MAVLHRADLLPTKLELLAAWLPSRRWYQGQAGAELRRVATYRFDDPAGAVGIETILVQAGAGGVHQIPLTYRDAPLDGGDRWLVGTMDHSVLGQRWVYDACGDRVYAEAMAGAIFAGAGQADEFFEVDGRLERREPTMTIASTGGQDTQVGVDGVVGVVGSFHRVVDDDPTLIVTEAVELAVVRRLGGGIPLAGAMLTGTWSGQASPVPLAYAARRGTSVVVVSGETR